MSQIVELKVAMSCQGCAGAVRRVLDKMEGVESYDINLEEQKVTVKGNVKPDEVLQTVSKCGKKTAFWEKTPAEPEAKLPEAVPGETEAKPADATPADAEAKPTEAAPAEAETKPTEAAPADAEAKAVEAPGAVAAA